MPNYGRLPMCPYFRDEKNRSISCEDCFKMFDSREEKQMWLGSYCTDWQWESCPYANEITEAYERFEEGDSTALENQKINAMQRELKGLSTKLGRAQKKIDELVELNKSYLRRNDELEKQRSMYYKRWRQESVKGLGETVMEQADKVLSMYKNVACYLLREQGGKVYEEDVEAWAKGKVYTIYREYDEEGRMVWQVIEEEAKESEDGKDTDIQDDATAQEGK